MRLSGRFAMFGCHVSAWLSFGSLGHFARAMQFDYQDKHYHTIRASDLQRDGMGLELDLGSRAVAEVFYSDATGDFTVSLFEQSLPLPVIERLIAEARVDLLPAGERLDK